MTRTVAAPAGPRNGGERRAAKPMPAPTGASSLIVPGFGRLWLTSLLLPTVCLALAGWWTWDNVVTAARGEMARTVDMVHEQVLRSLETQDAVLAGMGAFIAGMDWPEIRTSTAAQNFARSSDLATPTVETLGVIDPQGHIAVASETATPPPGLVLSDRDYVRAWPAGQRFARSEDRTFISQVIVSRLDGRVQVHASRPRLGADGRSDGGVLVSGFSPAYFERFFGAIAETAHTGFALVRDDGALLAGYPVPVTRSRQMLPPGNFALAALRGEVPVSHAGLGGHVRFASRGSLLTGLQLVAIRTIGGYGLTILHRLDPAVPAADWLRQMLWPTIGASAAMVLLLVLTARAQGTTRRQSLEQRYRTEAAEAGRAEAQERAELEARLRQTEQVAALGQLAAGVAHDFNNLLQTIILNGELVAREMPEGSRGRQSAALIVAASERGIALTRRMLDHTRAGRSAAQIRPEGVRPEDARPEDARPEEATIDIAQALHTVEALMAGSLGARHRVRLEIAPGLPPARGNAAEFESMVINLVANARDAMPAGGDIVIAATLSPLPDSWPPGSSPPSLQGQEAGPYIRLSVRDSGAGMDAATLARAGEAFFTTKPPGRGTGLGLSMVRGFTRRTGGALHFASTEGQGTTVTVWLPALRPSA